MASEHLNFQKVISDEDPILGLLSHPNRWHLSGFGGGCSCHFRRSLQNWSDDETLELPTFEAPFEWQQEDLQAIQSTKLAYDMVFLLLEQGHSVDLVDYWNGTLPDEIETMEVSLRQVPRNSFKFFEDYRFIFQI